MKKIIFGICTFSSFYLNAQVTNNEDIGSVAVLVQTATGSGSGFYLSDTVTNSLYFVTASHVLVDPQRKSIYTDSIILVSYKKNSQRDNRDSFKISLVTAYKSGQFRHNIQKDVAVLKIANFLSSAIKYLPFVTKLTLSNTYLNTLYVQDTKSIKDLHTMSDVYTIGYPKSLTLNINFDFNRPLIRRGIISGIDLNTNKIIADCPTYQGNSGGMVFQANLFDRMYVIGIVSQFVPFEEHWFNQAYHYSNVNVYNSGYTVVVPMDDVLAEINQLKK